MAVVFAVVCDRCRTEFRPERARSEWPARTRAAAHGWTHTTDRGVVLDVCPACLQASAPGAEVERAARRAVVHPTRVVDVEVAMCSWCEAGDCAWCTGVGCECTSSRHAPVPAAV